MNDSDTIRRQQSMIDKLIDNAFHADERLARASEICLSCAEESKRLIALTERVSAVFEAQAQYMQELQRRLVEYILTQQQVCINNQNSL